MEVTPEPSATPELPDPAESLARLITRPQDVPSTAPGPTASPDPTPAAPTTDEGSTFQVFDVPIVNSFVDTIVGGVAGAYFGP